MKKPVMSAKLVKEVKAVVHKPLKYVANQVANYFITDTINTNACTSLFPMCPNIIQGVDEYNRISDRVLPHKPRTHLTMYLDASNNYTADIYVRLICVNIKAVKSFSSGSGFPGRDLLNQGDGTSVDPPTGSGSTIDTLRQYSKYPINTKAYTPFHDRVYRLVKNQGQLTGDGSSTTSPVSPHASYHHVVIHHKSAPTQLKYDGATSTQPNNWYPVWCAYAWTSTGAPFSGGFVNIAVRTEMTYTDA
jgi:hypothetical protein